MSTHPTAQELIEAVIGFIETRAAPQLKDRDAFLARVAVNALATVKRELALAEHAETQAATRLRDLLGEDGDGATLNRRLCERIRSGDQPADAALFEHLRLATADQVRIDQPGYSGLKALEERI